MNAWLVLTDVIQMLTVTTLMALSDAFARMDILEMALAAQVSPQNLSS